MAQLAGSLVAPPPAAAAPDYFHLVVNGMVNQTVTPMSSSAFQFDGSAQWRLELPGSVIAEATANMTKPLGLCFYLTQVRLLNQRTIG
jgi:hypothetical protein